MKHIDFQGQRSRLQQDQVPGNIILYDALAVLVHYLVMYTDLITVAFDFTIFLASMTYFLASMDECPGSLCHSPGVRFRVGVGGVDKKL